MTSASMTFGRPTRLIPPRGALWFGAAAAALITALRRLDQWQLRSADDTPQTPQDVLAWARRIEGTQPGLAADLRAAALRDDGSSAR